MEKKKKRTFAVTLPIAGHAHLIVLADDEKQAIDEALNIVTLGDIDSWEAIEAFNEGNVCYCPRPWEAEAQDETPD